MFAQRDAFARTAAVKCCYDLVCHSCPTVVEPALPAQAQCYGTRLSSSKSCSPVALSLIHNKPKIAMSLRGLIMIILAWEIL